MSDEKTAQFLAENALESAFNLPDYPHGGQLDALCEEGCTVLYNAGCSITELVKARDALRSILQRMGDCDAHPALKLAVTNVWKPAIGDINAALVLLGER